MKLVGITGGVGMGKSTSAQVLEDWGVPVVDTDVLAHRLVEPGQPALEEIVASFGSDVVDSEGRLRRATLAEVVFSQPERRQALEAILHPRIRQAWMAEVARWRAVGLPLGAIVIPLLYETQAATEFDLILCVACSPASQQRRLRNRGWTEDQLERRIAAQWPTQKKMDQADRVIWTEPPVEIHREQLARALGR